MEGQDNQKEAKKPAVKTIKDAVAEKIAASGPSVLENVAQALASTEIARREGIVITAYAELNKKQNELNKMKPDAPTLTIVDGQKVKTETWTEAGYKKFEEAKAKVEKLSNALDKALEVGDADSFNKLLEASK